MDPIVRDSFWANCIGGGAFFAAYVVVRQSGAQKFLTLAKFTDIKWSIIHTVINMSVVHTLCVFVGLAVYAKYKECDPLASHMISKYDQIFPYFVTEIGASVPGISGLFIAAIWSAALR